MKSLFGRRTLATGVAAVASLAAFAMPSVASATESPNHCKGSTPIEGRGATFPEAAQGVWKKAFNEAAFEGKPGGCKSIEVKYNTTGAIGSGAGYNEWFKEQHYGEVAFVGTDNTVNQGEKEKIEAEVDAEKTSQLMTIPIVQGAVAIVVHLPEHCKANSKAAAGRIGLNQAMIEKIYKSGATWKEVAEEEGPQNEITNEGGTCDLTQAVTPVVRFDGSGTTHIFKEQLFKNDGGKLADETGGEHTWAELAEGTSSVKCGTAKDGKLNECWPSAAKVVHAKATGNPGLLEEVSNTAGSIGYADLSQARSKGFAPASTSKFWAVVESSAKATGKGVKRKYTDPSTNGDVATSENSNCKKTEFVNGEETFPPPSVLSPWNEVGAKRESKTYAFCGMTYVLANTNYAAYGSHGGTSNEAQSVKDYIGFVINKKGGATAIAGNDYAPLPKAVLAKAEEGVEKIG